MLELQFTQGIFDLLGKWQSAVATGGFYIFALLGLYCCFRIAIAKNLQEMKIQLRNATISVVVGIIFLYVGGYIIVLILFPICIGIAYIVSEMLTAIVRLGKFYL
ncbi:hypothetical protein KAZ66_05005 [Candidatus Woesebacteria bacterium]|nr:hypothetical protein [Candidatus Woesebacteria bacterium]